MFNELLDKLIKEKRELVATTLFNIAVSGNLPPISEAAVSLPYEYLKKMFIAQHRKMFNK